MTLQATMLWTVTAAIATTLAGAGAFWWWIEREQQKQRRVALAGCLADARLLFPLTDRDVDDLRMVAVKESWSGTDDVLNALSPHHAVDLPGALPRKLSATPAANAPPIPNTSEIEHNTRATLEVIEQDDADWRAVALAGRILGSNETGIIFEPDSRTDTLPSGLPKAGRRLPARGGPVKVTFRRDGDAGYEFRSFLAEDFQGLRLKIRHPDRLSRYQERSHARAQIGRLVDFGYLLEGELAKGLAEGGSGTLAQHLARGLLVDLSGGGAAIRSHTQLHPNDLVTLNLDRLGGPATRTLPPTGLVGRVIDCSAQTSDDPPWWLTRIKFVHIDEEERRCVVRYVDHRLLRGAGF